MKIVYKLPEGASCALIEGHAEYVAMCAHPERRPWFVTHDGCEVEIEIDPSASTEVSFLPDRYSGQLR